MELNENLNYVNVLQQFRGRMGTSDHSYIFTYPLYAERSLTTASSVRPGDMKTNVSESLLSSITSIHFIAKILNGVSLKNLYCVL